MKNLIANWKTTSLGLTAILGSVGLLLFQKPLDQTTYTMVVAGIITGIGFLVAKDGNVTGGTKQQ